jgi:hypothetical protein
VRNKNNLITRLIEKPPAPRGVYVLVTDKDDPNFGAAQRIADTFVGSGIPVTFSTATGLKSMQLKIIVFGQ